MTSSGRAAGPRPVALSATGRPGRPGRPGGSGNAGIIADLGGRHITYDERARGKSNRSADYSFEAAVRDVDAVLAAGGVDRALLVRWSYGAVVGAHWAGRKRAGAVRPASMR